MAVKKIFSIVTGLIIILGLAPFAHAQNLTCEMLGDPQATKDYIVTIVEEQFGKTVGGGEQTDGSSIQCFRVTTCGPGEGKTVQGELETQQVISCKSEYASKCTPNVAGGVTCQRIQVFYATSGTGLLFAYIGTIYRWAAGVIGVVTVLYFIWGGIEIAMAGDNTGKIDEAKEKIIQSIAGLVILFLSAVILYTINPNFFTL